MPHLRATERAPSLAASGASITAELESLVKNVRIVAAGASCRVGSSLPFHTAPISRIPRTRLTAVNM
jgi:hypothetical protein